jgi:hypothetical protein
MRRAAPGTWLAADRDRECAFQRGVGTDLARIERIRKSGGMVAPFALLLRDKQKATRAFAL